MTTRICSNCKQEKSIDKFSRNGKHVYSLCNYCKNLKTAMRRYNISFAQAEHIYAITQCECCQCGFTTKNPRHIHHLGLEFRGVICQRCNLILGQETIEDLYRIKACLTFIKAHRENFIGRDNQQGSLSDPSTTARLPRKNQYVCNRCQLSLSKEAFRVDRKWRRKTCKRCEVCLESARQYRISYKTAFELYSKSICDCCHQSFTPTNKITIHHVGDKVLGAVCDACNRRLGQETSQQILHLENCQTWINAMMVQSDLRGNMKS